MKVLDRYIVKNFLSTLFFMLIILFVIVIVIDINEKLYYSEDSGFTFFNALKNYYPYFMISILSTFIGILIFISTLFFTSRLSNNTEIIAIMSSGISFHRFARPYIIVSFVIMLCFIILNHFVLPWANYHKSLFEYSVKSLHFKHMYYHKKKVIAFKLSDQDYLFINSYFRSTKSGKGVHYLKFNLINQLLYEFVASDIKWNKIDNSYILYNYFERIVDPQQDVLTYKRKFHRKFNFTPDDLLPEELLVETMTTNKLLNFLDKEIKKGSSNVNSYYVELYQRTVNPFSILILMLFGLSIASKKKREGVGVNLALGLILAFFYIFFFEIFINISLNGIIHPLLGVILPNILFGIVMLYLYYQRVKI